MIRHLLRLSIVIAATSTAVAAAEPDRLKARAEAWQRALDSNADWFHFDERMATMVFSLMQFGGNCQIHMIYDPSKSPDITFKFVKDGKELFEIAGHVNSVFREHKNVLYFAHFLPYSQGCAVTAHDLETGKKLWETMLKALPPASHSAYSNKVEMGLTSLSTEENDEGVIRVTGRESYGDHVEILDRETGKTLAHKVYGR